MCPASPGTALFKSAMVGWSLRPAAACRARRRISVPACEADVTSRVKGPSPGISHSTSARDEPTRHSGEADTPRASRRRQSKGLHSRVVLEGKFGAPSPTNPCSRAHREAQVVPVPSVADDSAAWLAPLLYRAVQLVEVEVRKHALPAFFALFFLCFTYDVSYNKFGTSNGKFISLVDTCLNVFQYRLGSRHAQRSQARQARHAVWIVLASFVIKFASGVMVSVLVDKEPVVIKNWRHIAFFFVGLAALWLTPGDIVYGSLERSRAVRVCLLMGSGLYKMRKAFFAVDTAARAGGGLIFALLLTVVAVDGNTLVRRGVHWLEQRCCHRDVSWVVVTESSRRGVTQALLGTMLPLGLLTASVWGASRMSMASGAGMERIYLDHVDPAYAGGIEDEALFTFRACALMFFIWRAGAFRELAEIHSESLATCCCGQGSPSRMMSAGRLE